MKHSPGPWVIDQNAAIVNPKVGHMVYAEGCDGYNGHLICDLKHAYSDNQTANATLIAASPDLLDACEQILGLSVDYTNPEDYVRLVRRLATTAIKKAKGKS